MQRGSHRCENGPKFSDAELTLANLKKNGECKFIGEDL